MKWIDYAGTRLETSDAIADAVIQYAVALARHGIADHVHIPVVTANGSIAQYDMLLGPASQLIALPAVSAVSDPDDRALLDDLAERIRLLEPIRAVAEPIDEVDDGVGDFELPPG